MLCHTGPDARHRFAVRLQVLVHIRVSQDFSAFAGPLCRACSRQTLVAVAVNGESRKAGISDFG